MPKKTNYSHMKLHLVLPILLLVNLAFAQPTQTVRGKIMDAETQFPLAGARIEIFTQDTINHYRAIGSIDGEFSIENVPIGKHELVAKLMTYEDKSITIEVNSGKQSIVSVPMMESFQDQEEVTVVATKKGTVINEMALLSAQQFSVEETNRYPGSRSDPARMASNFAGVGGADDSRNDIVIRGNSPLGVVYRVEGIDIPNPSHFSISGSSGGPVSILNNKILANSDFFMSAFPAEYGNSTSGVFDLKLRNGNNERHEFTGQFGFLGTEVMAEGPMSKTGNSSYLIMGRYSTLSMFQALGIKIGTDAVPVYGDGAVKFNWRLKNGGALSLFAIGGASTIEILVSDKKEYTEDLYGESDRDQYFNTSMYVGGLSYKKPLNEKTFVATSFAFSQERQHSKHDFLIRSVDANNQITIDDLYRLQEYTFTTSKGTAYFSLKHKVNKKHLIQAGINADVFYYNMVDSVLAPGHSSANHSNFNIRWDYTGTAMLIQPFIQWKWRMTEKMDFTLGLHNQYYSLSNSISVAEPRIGWRLNLNKGQAISLGAGMHSQTQPQYTYLYHQTDSITGERIYHNKNMDFSKSIHSALGYEKTFGKGFNIKAEAYYQYLYNIPVTITPSAFSLINMGSGFQRFFPEPLENTGTGYNYGLELTVQKYFDKSFFFMFSGTVYDSKYTGSDGELRNTSYNGLYIANALGGKEFKIGAKQSISVGLKVTVAGGKRYGYVDIAASEALNELIFENDGYNSRQFRDYFRMDVKVNWKYNTKRTTHEIGLDLVNITGYDNFLSLTYAPDLANPAKEPVGVKSQLGFLPIFYYKIDLRLGGKNKEK